MEILNENYFILILNFNDERKFNNDSFLISLKGDEKLYKLYKDNNKNVIFNNIPKNIEDDYFKKFPNRIDQKEDDVILRPIDFSIIKKITYTHEAESYKFGKKIVHTRFVNIPPGVITVYKYTGTILHTEEFLHVFNNYFKNAKGSIHNDIISYKIIICSESRLLDEIMNQNYFLIYLLFKGDKKADPNDFRRSLLGIQRKKKKKGSNLEYEYVSPSPDIISKINQKFHEYTKKNSIENDGSIIYPISFSIIKKPVLISAEKNKNKPYKFSDRAAGVIVLYKYMGSITQIQNFKQAFSQVFEELFDKENSLFKRVNNYNILIGADLFLYNNF